MTDLRPDELVASRFRTEAYIRSRRNRARVARQRGRIALAEQYDQEADLEQALLDKIIRPGDIRSRPGDANDSPAPREELR